jgi:hypothetical protein
LLINFVSPASGLYEIHKDMSINILVSLIRD